MSFGPITCYTLCNCRLVCGSKHNSAPLKHVHAQHEVWVTACVEIVSCMACILVVSNLLEGFCIRMYVCILFWGCVGSPLPWNSTLEQLGFGETPELRLKERIRSRVASRSSSIGASTQITM